MRKALSIGVLMGWTLACAASAAEAPPLDFEPVTIQMIGTSAGSPPWLIQESFWKPMGEKTGGKLNVTIQSSTDLGLKGPEEWQMAKTGVANIAMSPLGFSSGDVPENDGIDLPGLALDLTTLKKAADAYAPYLKSLYAERHGLEILGMWPLAAQVLWCSVPITGLDDLKGKKVRVSGAAPADFIEAVGGIPTTIAFAEVVPSLQRGVIDCAVTGTVAGNVAHWTEVTTHLYPIVIGWGMSAIYANKNWWDGLDPKARDYISYQFDEMTKLGWEQAELGTNQGIWCTVGDERCEPAVIVPKPLEVTHLTLVPVTDADIQKRLQLIEQWTLPRYAQRCGEACVENWNKTIGPVYGVTAKMP